MSEIMMKAVLWEQAKGALRASAVASLTSAESANTSESFREQRMRWQKFDAEVERFIARVEDDALQE